MESKKKYGLNNERNKSKYNASENITSNIKFAMVQICNLLTNQKGYINQIEE